MFIFLSLPLFCWLCIQFICINIKEKHPIEQAFACLWGAIKHGSTHIISCQMTKNHFFDDNAVSGIQFMKNDPFLRGSKVVYTEIPSGKLSACGISVSFKEYPLV